MGFGNVGLRCGRSDNYRDVFCQVLECRGLEHGLCMPLPHPPPSRCC